MAEEYVELALRGFEAFNRGDLEAVEALLADDVEVLSPPELPNSGHFQGHAGFREWASAWLEAWDEFRVEIRETAVAGETLVTSVRQFGSGRGSGLRVEMDLAYVVRFRDGQVASLELHPDPARALAEVRGGGGG